MINLVFQVMTWKDERYYFFFKLQKLCIVQFHFGKMYGYYLFI